MTQIKIQTFDQYGVESHRICFMIENTELKKIKSICKEKMRKERNEQLKFNYIFGAPKPQFPDIIITYDNKEVKTKWRNYNKHDLFWLNNKND